MRKTLNRTLAFVLGMVICACAHVGAANERAEVPRGCALGLCVLGELDTGFGSAVVSPQSLYLALELAAQGARGDTREEFERVLGVAPDGDADAAALAALEAAGVNSACAYFKAADIELNPEYRAVATEKYGAQGFELGADTVRRVNAWASEHTDGMITEVLAQPPKENTKLLLINALAMEAEWRLPFDGALTAKRSFSGAGGETLADMMSMTGEMLYAEVGDAQLAYLPYEADGLGMFVILPPEGGASDTLAALARGAGEGKLPGWLGALERRQVSLSMPRASLSEGGSLKEALKAVGLNTAFSNLEADFGGMSGSYPLYMGDVIQNCALDIAERGTRAAAVTAVMMEAGCAYPEPESVKMDVNRPYIVLVTLSGEGGVSDIEQLLFAAIVHDV